MEIVKFHIMAWGDFMPISFAPMRQYMQEHQVSYYYLANQGIDSATLHRIRHDQNITMETLGKICEIMQCQPADLICYLEEEHQE